MLEPSWNTCGRLTRVHNYSTHNQNLQHMRTLKFLSIMAVAGLLAISCNNGGQSGAISSSGDAASRVYVPPGQYDEFYSFLSGGFSGQLSVYGLPSGRLFKIIPVFSVDAEKGYGFNEETKPMLKTSHGFHPGTMPTTRTFANRWCA